MRFLTAGSACRWAAKEASSLPAAAIGLPVGWGLGEARGGVAGGGGEGDLTVSLPAGTLRRSMTPATPQQRFQALGLVLPPAPKPIGAYVPSLVLGNFLYASGHLPILPDGSLVRGRVGGDLDADGGKQAARQVALTILATLQATVGSLDRVRRVVKVLGMVNCTPEFEQHPHVLNGCSELFAEIWGRESGIGVRSAVGVASLPSGVPVEIEALFELA